MSLNIEKIVQYWIGKENLWSEICERGSLLELEDVASQIGIQEPLFTAKLKEGIPIRGGRNRLQHLCFIPPKYVGTDSESTTKKCLSTWLETIGYKTIGVDGLEVNFNESGLKAIANLAKSKQETDFQKLKQQTKRNGIDLVAFNPKNGQVLIIELKGWTGTSGDFNETVHQIVRRILDFRNCCGLLPNIKFACAFPNFRFVGEWQRKFATLKSLKRDSTPLYYFSSATNVRKDEGKRFFKQFTVGSIAISNLISQNKLDFLLVKSANETLSLFNNQR